MLKRILSGMLALACLSGGALAEVYAGRTVAAATVAVSAKQGGALEAVLAQPGDAVESGDILARLRTRKVFAAEDGTVARVLVREGVRADGAVLEISPVSRYTIHCTVDGAYPSAAGTRVRVGETLYVRCTVNGTHRASGVIVGIDGDEYTVETTGGELYVGEAVRLYRDEDFATSGRAGVGTVVASDPRVYESQGTVVRLHVAEGEFVERGELLYELADGTEVELAAPTSGIVTEAAAPGDALSAGQAALTIAPFDQLQVELTLDETAAARLTPGDEAELIFADDPDETPIPGKVLSVSRVAEGGSYAVRVAPEVPPQRLGLTAYVRLWE